MAIKLADTLAPMADFPAAMAEHVEFADGENLQQKLDDGSLGGSGTIDSDLSMTSENPVKNSVVTKALNERRKEYILSTTVANTYVVVPLRYQETITGSHYVTLADETGDLIIVCGSSKLGTLKAFRVNPDAEPNITNLYCLTSSTYLTSTLYVQRKNSSSSITITGSNSPSFLRYEPSDRGEEIPIEPLGGDSSITLTQAEYDALTDEEKNNGKEYRTYDTGHIYKLGVEYGKDACFTSLSQLGLTADATLQNVIDKLPKGSSALLGVKEFTNYQTIFPYEDGNDQFARVHIVKGVADGSSMYARWFRKDGSKEAIAKFNINNNLFESWKIQRLQQTYTELVQLGLTADATVDDVLSKLQPGETFTAGVTQFTNYQTLFPYDSSNDQYSRIFIQQGTSLATAYVKWFRKDGSREALANLDSNNKIKGWNEHTMNEIIHTSLSETLAGITTTLDLINALITEYRAKNKPVRFISGSITKNQLTDLPSNYGLLDIKVAGYDLAEVSFARSEYGFKIMYYGFLNRTSSETLFSSLTWSKSNNIYYTIEDLNAIKGTNIELVKDEDNTIKIIEALGDREEFVEWFNNGSTMDRFGIPDEFGNKITYLRIIKTDSKYALIIATTNKGFTFSRVYNLGVLEDWCYDRTKATLVTNATTLKLDVTKRNTSWYGAIKLTYLYDTSPVEVEIDFRNATDTLKWTISKGQKYIKKITYTQDSSNKAHYTIGIEFSGTTYGCYQAEVIGGFADINSLTADAFTGDTTAVYGNPYGKNNGVTLVSAPEDLGLTSPCTTVQLVQAMRNTFNKTITSGAIGVFNNGGNTITDAPSDYGLLHIEVFGHDRVLIRYDGIGGSTYAGSWIGRVKGSNGTFSEVTFERENNIYSTGEEVIGTWIDGSTIYRKVLSISSIDAKTSTSTVTLGDAPVSEQNMLKIEGFVNLIGNQYFIHYPNIASDNDSINATLKIANGYFKLTGTWKYPINKGAIIVEYLKS